jgi:N-acyl-D-amino-acid deacylase
MKVLAGVYVRESSSSHNQAYVDRRVIDIAQERGEHFADTLLDIALRDDLTAKFEMADVVHADVEVVATVLHHPLVQIGSSDSGAHGAQFAGSGDPGFIIEHFVRRHRRMSLERAVHRLTMIDEIPGGGGRYVRRPRGINKVFVNGQLFVDEGRYTDNRPGRLV